MSKQHKKSRLLPIVCILLSACASVGPEYTAPPSVDLPEAWNQHIGQAEDQAKNTDTISSWWLQFNDPVLNTLIDQLETKNFDLRLAVSRISEAELQYGITSTSLYPTLDSSASYSRERFSQNQRGIPARTQTSRSLALNVSWELDLFGRIQREREASAYSIDVLIENYRDILVVLKAQIASLYIESHMLQERLQFAYKNIENQTDTLNLVQARYKAELVSEIDVTRAQQNLARTQTLIPRLQASQTQILNNLAVLLGQLPGSMDHLVLTSESTPNFSHSIMNVIPKDLLRQRPDIRRAERNLAVQTARIGIATADLYPRFSLAGVFGLATVSSDFLSRESQFGEVGPNASWNLFNAGQTRKRIKVEELRLEQAKTRYEETVLRAIEEVENSLVHYTQEQQRLAYLQASTAAAKKTVKLAKERYRLGLTSFQEVLDAERILFSEEDSLAISQGTLRLQFINIYRAMGGGWKASQVIPMSAENTAEK